MAFVGGISFGSGGAYGARAKLTGSETFAERSCAVVQTLFLVK